MKTLVKGTSILTGEEILVDNGILIEEDNLDFIIKMDYATPIDVIETQTNVWEVYKDVNDNILMFACERD